MNKLNCEWILWLHLANDSNWDKNSYINLCEFKYIEEVIVTIEELPDILIQNSMIYIMRKGIFPSWEDKKNINGGALSYKTPINYVNDLWKKISLFLVSENLTNNINDMLNINGISISPKKKFCIIKIWIATKNNNIIINDIENLSKCNCIFKLHGT